MDDADLRSRATGSFDAHAAFAALDPQAVLDALEHLGWRTDGRVLALNSYENRVFRVGIEDGRPLVAKFYRPGRWTDAAILEEHGFAQELATEGLPVVPPLVVDERTLHAVGGHRLAVFPLRGGRAPDCDRRQTLLSLGGVLARMHLVGARRPFLHRPTLDVESHGDRAVGVLLDGGWLPPALEENFERLADTLLDRIETLWEAVSPATLRLHGDCHPGNILWDTPPGTDGAPHFVDLDDALNGPAIQDLWMLMPPQPDAPEREWLLEGYAVFGSFDVRELRLVESLRTLRMLHHSAWIARRWSDPAFPRAFGSFASPRHFESLVAQLQEQLALLQES